MRIVESATLGSVGQGDLAVVSSIWGQQFLAWRFHVSIVSKLTKVGGHIRAGSPDFPELTLFAAVVKLPAHNALPSFAPRAIDSTLDTLAHTLFVPTWPSSDILIQLPASVVLAPGHYGLVFGGVDSAVNYSPFGATGTGGMTLNNTDLTGSSYFWGDAYRWQGLTGPQKQRFVVEIEEVAGSDQSPPSAPTGLNVS